MKFHETYKFKLRPTPEQKEQFRQFAGCRRWVWNYMLDRRREYYQETGEYQSMTEQCRKLTDLKNKYEWLGGAHSQVLQQSIRDLDQAFQNFFNQTHNFPNYKSKREKNQTFRFPQDIRVDGSRVRIPKIGWVRFFRSQDIEGEIKSATVKKQAYGWHIAINTVQTKEVNWEDSISIDNIVGIDLGLNHFATLSDGTKIDNPRCFEQEHKRLRKAQQKLSRKEHQSNNWHKQNNRVNRIHADIRRKRKDFLHKLTSTLVDENQAIIVESLDVESMKRGWLGKSISDASWSEFVRQLRYKCRRSGTYLVELDQYEPTTKTCRFCKHKNDVGLSDRQFECNDCGKSLDRDVNAAKNIKRIGIEQLDTGGQPGRASGGYTSGVGNTSNVKVFPVNEEPSIVA